MNGVDIHDQLKTSYEIDRNSRFRYYLRIFLDLIDSVVVNAHLIYKKRVNAKMSLLNFKSLINWFSSRKCKFTAKEPQLIVKLPQTLKEPDLIVQFIEKRQWCQYCFTNGKKDVKCFTYCKSYYVSLCV